VEDRNIVLKHRTSTPRDGWDGVFRRMAASGDGLDPDLEELEW
jgi:hypothetical protein